MKRHQPRSNPDWCGSTAPAASGVGALAGAHARVCVCGGGEGGKCPGVVEIPSGGGFLNPLPTPCSLLAGLGSSTPCSMLTGLGCTCVGLKVAVFSCKRPSSSLSIPRASVLLTKACSRLESRSSAQHQQHHVWSLAVYLEASKVVIVAMPCKIQGWMAAVDGVVADKPIISNNSKSPRGDF
eukprot:364277-Chlamydomonas_euryale.AAC.6